MAEYTGLVGGVTDALIGTYKAVPTHGPGRGVRAGGGAEQVRRVGAVGAKARAAAWAAGAGPDLGEELRLDRRGDPEGVGGHQHRPTPSAPAAAVSRTTMLAFSALGNTDALATSRRMSRPDIGLAMTPTVASATSRWRLTRQPLACCSPIALPCPPPSRVPSAGYA